MNESRNNKYKELSYELRGEKNNYAIIVGNSKNFWKVVSSKKRADALANSIRKKGKKVKVTPVAFPVTESKEIAEKVQSGNKGSGYHGQFPSAKADIKFADKHAELVKRFGKTLDTFRDRSVYAKRIKDVDNETIIKHFMDSSDGRHLPDVKSDTELLNRFKRFLSRYDKSLFESIRVTKTDCKKCKGTGKINHKTICPHCKGTGKHEMKNENTELKTFFELRERYTSNKDVELDEQTFNTPYGVVTVSRRDTRGMRGRQDGYSMTLKKKNGKTVSLGSHPRPTEKAANAIAKNLMKRENEEVEQIDESLPPHLQKLLDKSGNIDPKKVKKHVKVRGRGKSKVTDVTPKGYGPKEEVEQFDEVNANQIKKDLDSGMSHDAVIGKHANKRATNTDEIRKVIKQHAWNNRMKKEEVEIDELTDKQKAEIAKRKEMRMKQKAAKASKAAANKAKREKNKGARGGEGAYDKRSKDHIIMQMRAAQDLTNVKKHELTFRRGKKAEVSREDINAVLSFYDALTKPDDKRKLRIQLAKGGSEAVKKLAAIYRKTTGK